MNKVAFRWEVVPAVLIFFVGSCSIALGFLYLLHICSDILQGKPAYYALTAPLGLLVSGALNIFAAWLWLRREAIKALLGSSLSFLVFAIGLLLIG